MTLRFSRGQGSPLEYLIQANFDLNKKSAPGKARWLVGQWVLALATTDGERSILLRLVEVKTDPCGCIVETDVNAHER